MTVFVHRKIDHDGHGFHGYVTAMEHIQGLRSPTQLSYDLLALGKFLKGQHAGRLHGPNPTTTFAAWPRESLRSESLYYPKINCSWTKGLIQRLTGGSMGQGSRLWLADIAQGYLLQP
jgi:hypothetical protein